MIGVRNGGHSPNGRSAYPSGSAALQAPPVRWLIVEGLIEFLTKMLVRARSNGRDQLVVVLSNLNMFSACLPSKDTPENRANPAQIPELEGLRPASREFSSLAVGKRSRDHGAPSHPPSR